MIEFHLETRSGVPTYLQIVQQVRQAVRLGVLRPGDQAADGQGRRGHLTVNPNTVLKAYRDLDREGLVEGRRGVGTFVAAGVAPLPPGDVQDLRSRLEGWIARARGAGLDDDAMAALFMDTLRARRRSGALHDRDQHARTRQALRLKWALRDCTIEVPEGSVTALVGPNGAGKTTLLQLAVGLTRPSAGHVTVLGLSPRRTRRSCRASGSSLREHPLHRGFTVAETLKLGRKLNPGWDDALAHERLQRLDLPLDRTVGRLSGGQRAQVALTVALAKRPELLLLDEPVASLDPLARREFLNALMEAVSETGVTVILSSHIVAELERVCDHLVNLARRAPSSPARSTRSSRAIAC